MAKELTGGRMIDPIYTAKNLLIIIAISILSLFLTAVAATYFTISEFAIDILVSVITGICIVLGGFRTAKHAGRQGLLNGALFGLIYILVVYIIGVVVDKSFSFTTASVLSLIIGVACGAIGGIVGVNTKFKKR